VISYTVNDTAPVLSFILQQDGIVIDLTTALSVQFKLLKPSGAVVTKTMTIDVAPTTGRVSLSWGVGELSEAGTCYGEVFITWPSSVIQHGEYRLPVYVRAEYGEAF